MAARPSKRARKQATTKTATRGIRIPRRRAPELDLRRTPMQARGLATFDRILDVTARLLEKVGTEALTTNLIARTAEVNVATLYQYFPNKQAVLLALFKRQNDALVELAERMTQGFGAATDWRRVVNGVVQAVAQARATTPGVVALRQAMRSSPDLLAHDQRMSRYVATVLAGELVRAGTRPDKAMVVARCAIEALAALLDMWSIESDGMDGQIVEQAKAMMAGYLAPYVEAGTVSGKSGRRPRG
jgi:AcrR family transcriptional regulator